MGHNNSPMPHSVNITVAARLLFSLLYVASNSLFPTDSLNSPLSLRKKCFFIFLQGKSSSRIVSDTCLAWVSHHTVTLMPIVMASSSSFPASLIDRLLLSSCENTRQYRHWLEKAGIGGVICRAWARRLRGSEAGRLTLDGCSHLNVGRMPPSIIWLPWKKAQDSGLKSAGLLFPRPWVAWVNASLERGKN